MLFVRPSALFPYKQDLYGSKIFALYNCSEAQYLRNKSHPKIIRYKTIKVDAVLLPLEANQSTGAAPNCFLKVILKRKLF
jgi:hypothetical protein